MMLEGDKMIKKKLEKFFSDSFDVPLECILDIPK